MTRGRRPRLFKGSKMRRELRPNYSDPNRPGSPGYTDRHRQSTFDIGPGMRRIDAGGPCPAPGRQVAAVREAPPAEPEATPAATAAPAPSTCPDAAPERDWRKECGLGRGGRS